MTVPNVVIVGAGLSGAVLARELADRGIRCLVVDRKSHVAGNCYTRLDVDTGIMEHVYGAHVFNTDNETIWSYIQRFCTMGAFINRVKVDLPSGVYSFPINLHTINQFFGLRLNPTEARAFLAAKGDSSIVEPKSFEEQALRFVGPELYRAFFYGYTKKQWGCEPSQLPASILKRVPIRFNYDDRYYSGRFQGIPKEGYTVAVERILDHPHISVKLDTTWEEAMRDEFDYIFYTGALDAFYGFRCGRLGYRTVYWNKISASGDFQGNAVLNYPSIDVPHTRICEHKHFTPWESHERTIAFVEFSKETGPEDIPYYPKRLAPDLETLTQYQALARSEDNVFFLGRLATYRYLDMHVVIDEALRLAQRFLQWRRGDVTERPVFASEL